jgi:hypothetical protein
MKLALALALMIAGAPGLARAQVSAGVSINIGGGALVGEPINSLDVFYDQLSPYGVWVDDPRAGRVFIPDQAGYVPYTNGHWQYTDVGMVWVSSEPFAWATSHYGRWWWSDEYGRWVWVPDTTWGPAWVDWRYTDGLYGWAPMAPAFALGFGYVAPIDSWSFCPAEHIVDVDARRFFLPRDRVVTVVRDSRPVTTYANVGNTRVVYGPPPESLRSNGVTRQPLTREPRQMGRLQPQELQQAQTRARERMPQFEQRNQARLQARPQLNAAVRRAGAQPATGRAPEPRQPEREHAQPTQPRPEREQTTPTQPTPPRVESRPEPQTRAEPQPHARPEARPQPEARPSPPPRAQPQPRAEPPHAEPRPAAPPPHAPAQPRGHRNENEQRDH